MSHIGRYNMRRVAPASLVASIRPSRRLTLLSAMHVSGTGTPPAVTLSGSLTQSRGVYLECTTGGARASTVWKHCLDFDGTTSPGGFTTGVSGAASLDLGLGITANLPNASYTSGDFYRGVVSTLVDAYGQTIDNASGAESVRPFVEFVNGRPTLRADGIARFLDRNTSNALANAVAMGDDLSYTIAGWGRYNGSLTPTNFQAFLSFCNGSAGAAGFASFGVNPAGGWRCGKRGDSAGTVNRDEVTPSVTNNPFRFIITHTGTLVGLWIDNGSITLDGAPAGTQNVTAIAGGTGYLMLGHLSVPGLTPTEFPGDFNIGDTYYWTGVRSATERAIIDQVLKNDAGL